MARQNVFDVLFQLCYNAQNISSYKELYYVAHGQYHRTRL